MYSTFHFRIFLISRFQSATAKVQNTIHTSAYLFYRFISRTEILQLPFSCPNLENRTYDSAYDQYTTLVQSLSHLENLKLKHGKFRFQMRDAYWTKKRRSIKFLQWVDGILVNCGELMMINNTMILVNC